MIIDLDNPENWPTPIIEYLSLHHGLFLGWEQQGEGGQA